MPASRSETAAARYLERIVRQYGPLNERQVRGYAQWQESKGRPDLVHGLNAVAREMRPDEVVTGRVKPGPRAPRRLRSPRAGRSR